MAFRMVTATARTGARTGAGDGERAREEPMTRTKRHGLAVPGAFVFIAVLASLAIGCSSGGSRTLPTSDPQVAAPDRISGTAPVTVPVSELGGTGKTTTWSNRGDGIYIANFKNKNNVEPGYATLGCRYSDTDPQAFIDQTEPQRFDDVGAYHFILETEVACARTIACEVLRTGPQGYSGAQMGNHLSASDVIASHGYSTNHCGAVASEPNSPCSAAVTIDYGRYESGNTYSFYDFRATTASGPLAGTFELGGQPLPDPFHVVRTTVVQTVTPTFVSSLGCRTDFTLTVNPLPSH